ncbi:glycoside hydrolase family 16 protein [Enterococcus ureasiticus]|uniref:Beta-galactosidase n=1 Tax=Enterococcus ureasiticus TaxID=903984 RepID=A0A1E5GHE4_9ENTE|nr:glycoside hydrolase family 16 protein [Enterococcus ureasiticus]OEG12077.1 beta-galactosidase [Enterococcus ureasiticus]
MKKIVFSGVILCSSLFSFAFQSHAAQTSIEKPGYTLDFNDEFDGDHLDTSKWTDYYLPHWTSNPENAKANYRFENGTLVQYIKKDQKPWSPELDGNVKSSAIMSFNKNWIHNFSGSQKVLSNQKEWTGYATTYGYFELRAKLSNVGGGGHQAWWMVGMQNDTNDWFNSKQTGEIDVIETFFSKPNTWRIAAFGWNDPAFQTNWKLIEDPVPYGNQTEEFHTYGLDWSPGSLKFYYDGVLYKEIAQAPDYPMGTILNIYTDAGSGVGNDKYPKEWAIDYFRVYKKNEGYDILKQPIQSRETKEYVSFDTSSDKVKLVTSAGENEQWQLVPKGEYFLIKNVKTGELLHNEHQKDYVEHGAVPETFYSAQWKKQSVDGYVRLINRWKSDQVIHIENNLGYLESGPIHEGAWRSQWSIK